MMKVKYHASTEDLHVAFTRAYFVAVRSLCKSDELPTASTAYHAYRLIITLAQKGCDDVFEQGKDSK